MDRAPVHEYLAARSAPLLHRDRSDPGVHDVLVARDGGLTQFVKFTDRAWHAGLSSYHGRGACNDFSIGIELEGCDTVPYEPAQYAALARIVAALCKTYPRISSERLVGHSDIPQDGRRIRASFDWQHARRCVAEACLA